MPVVFFTLCILSFGLGIFNILVLAFVRMGLRERGLRSLLMPMIPLALVTFLQIFHYYFAPSGSGFVMRGWWQATYDTGRILIAMGWISVTFHHYALNGIEEFRKGWVVAFGILLACVWLVILADVFSPADLREDLIGNVGIVSVLYFAGIRAVFILRHRKPLLESTKTALSIAVLSLAIYPGIALGDAFGWNLRFLEDSVPLWIQAHPLYYMLVNVPILVYAVALLKRRALPDSASKTDSPHGRNADGQASGLSDSYGLTPRETDVAALVLNGYRNQQIADILGLSLATVKTHVSRIYGKMDVSSRSEMFVEAGRRE